MKVFLLAAVCLFAVARSESELKIEDGGNYNFKYSLDDEGGHKREESGSADGSVSGSYSYIDPNGDLRTVNYKAGPGIGFQASGDISVDKNTAEKASELAALAPKAPEEPKVDVKIPASPFTWPAYHHHAPGVFYHHAPAVPSSVLPYPLAYNSYPYHHPYGHQFWY